LRKTLFIICVLIILMPPLLAQAISLKWEKWFDSRVYFLDCVQAASPRGETVKSMVKRSKAVTGVNGTFFGRDFINNQSTLFPIGILKLRLLDVSKCPAPKNRGYLWQDTSPHIGFEPPKTALVVVQAGPILILKDKFVQDYQGFSRRHWNRKVLRTVIAIKDHKIFLMKIHGSLWQVGKWLKQRKMQEAISLDGGNSSLPHTKVANAILVFPKSRPIYKTFSRKYLQPTSWTENISNSPRVSP